MEFTEFFVYFLASIGVLAIINFWICVFPKYVMKAYTNYKKNRTKKRYLRVMRGF